MRRTLFALLFFSFHWIKLKRTHPALKTTLQLNFVLTVTTVYLEISYSRNTDYLIFLLNFYELIRDFITFLDIYPINSCYFSKSSGYIMNKLVICKLNFRYFINRLFLSLLLIFKENCSSWVAGVILNKFAFRELHGTYFIYA